MALVEDTSRIPSCWYPNIFGRGWRSPLVSSNRPWPVGLKSEEDGQLRSAKSEQMNTERMENNRLRGVGADDDGARVIGVWHEGLHESKWRLLGQRLRGAPIWITEAGATIRHGLPDPQKGKDTTLEYMPWRPRSRLHSTLGDLSPVQFEMQVNARAQCHRTHQTPNFNATGPNSITRALMRNAS